MSEKDSIKKCQDRSIVLRVLLAAGYWGFATVTFFVDFPYGLLATLPLSYFIVGAQMRLAAGHPFVGFLNGLPGRALIFPGLCGGLNAAIIYGFLSALSQRKPADPMG